MSESIEEKRTGEDRRQRLTDVAQERRRRGRRAADEILELATHPAKHVTPRQLAEYWGVNVGTVIDWLKSGKLRGFRPGGREWRIRKADALARERDLDREAS